jgi:hypothetical protein
MRGREDRSCRARRIHGEGRLAVVAKVDLKKERKLCWILPTEPSLWLPARKSQHFTSARLSLGGTASYIRR